MCMFLAPGPPALWQYYPPGTVGGVSLGATQLNVARVIMQDACKFKRTKKTLNAVGASHLSIGKYKSSN